MKIKTFISLTVACVLLIGFFVGVRFQAFRAGRQAAPAEEDTSAYGERFARAARLLSANTLAVSDVADAVSQSWIQAVALGLDSSSQVEKVFAELEESGVRPKLARAHEELTQQMQDLQGLKGFSVFLPHFLQRARADLFRVRPAVQTCAPSHRFPGDL